MTADVLSWVMTRCGRMERKSPVRRGREGPSARWVWAIFSVMVWGTGISQRQKPGELRSPAQTRVSVPTWFVVIFRVVIIV
jgi:hypothetical protein